jgi:flagellar biosynthesis component FlhA
MGFLGNLPGLMYIKVALVAALVAGAAWASWRIKAGFAEAEKQEAVAAAVQEIQNDLNVERALRSQYETLAEAKLSALLKSMSDLRAQSERLGRDIQSERQAFPEFYSQPLPETGYEKWMRARNLVASPPASAASQ